MKTYRNLVSVLAVLAVLISGLCVSCGKKPVVAEQPQQPPQEMWHTNTVEMWHTNTVEMWYTNTVEVQHTNTVVQTVTNEVIKHIPAKLSAEQLQASATGHKFTSAPAVEGKSDPLYKVTPLAVTVNIDDKAASVLGANADAVTRSLDFALSSQAIPRAAQSPYNLILDVTSLWKTDEPRVAILELTLDLKQTATVQRGGDLIKCPAVVWTTTVTRLIRTVDIPNEVRLAVNDVVGQFAKDWLQAKKDEASVQAKIPAFR